MNELTQRIKRVVESILENERLTTDLDDSAAEVLLNWGVACARMIAESTAGLSDDEAEEAMYPRLRAMRRLMRSVNKWAAGQYEMDAERGTESLAKMIRQAVIIYGKDFVFPGINRRNTFLQEQAGFADDPSQLIGNLRQLLEPPNDEALLDQGEHDDQENY